MPTQPWPSVDEAFVAQFAATYGFKLGHPQEVTIAPDGDVLFTRTEARSFVADLYQRDAATGEVTKLLDAATLLGGADETLSAEERARRERMRHATRGIAGYALSEDGRRILVPLSNRLFVFDRDTAAVKELATGDGFPYDPRFSPDGAQVAYVVDGDLWTVRVDGGAARRLTTRAADTIEHGVAEFVAQEEMGRRRGYWWSPDGGQVAYQRSDLSKVDTLWVADPAHPDTAPTPFRYPRAGTANVDVTLGVMPTAGGEPTWIAWDRARWPYLCRVQWSARAPLTLIVMNRAQTELAVLAADVATGETTALLTERDDAWLELDDNVSLAWLADGSGFVWATERAGGWQLELRGQDGALVRALTEPALGMQTFYGLAGDAAWFAASSDPIQTHVWSVPIAGGAPRQVTTEDGIHAAKVSARAEIAVMVSSLRDGALRYEVRDRGGRVLGTLPSVAEAPPWLPEVAWETVDAGGLGLRTAIVRPRDFDPKRRYPVLLHVYAGPSKRMVIASPRAYLLDQWYADAGFIVVAVDNRGTPGRDRAWSRAIHKDLITVPLADQVAGLEAVGAAHPELDLARVGIYGWSFGGYVSAMAVELRPDVFRAAVAGAPVTDWALYDTFYTERYMQTPAANPDGYARGNAITHAASLTRPLLVIHGTTDDNVHFAHSLGLVEALFRAGKDVELLPVSATHMTPDPEVAIALHRKQLAFFRAHL